jgi:iron complex outermembrane receptor protein
MRQTKSRSAISRCVVAALTTAAAGGVQAADDAEEVTLEEVVVTAQFREQNLQDAPLAITAISAEMLQARSQTNLAEVANQAPSVTLKPQAGIYGPSLAASIRGVGQFDYNPALEPGVGVYVDDVYFATLTGSIFDLLDLDRVEILRGPQGTLAGRNSIGGAVKLYSKKPEGSDTGQISGTYGSRDRTDLRGSVDLGLSDQLALRVAGVAKRQDGYITRYDYGCLNPDSGIPQILAAGDGCVLGKEGEVNYQAVRAQLRYRPSDNLDINIAGDFTNESRSAAGQVLRVANYTGTNDINPFPGDLPFDSRWKCGPYCNYATYISYADGVRPNSLSDGRTTFDGFGFSGNIEWKLTDTLRLTSISAYREYETRFSTDNDLSPLAHSFGRSDVSFHSFSQELRLSGSVGDGKVEYTIGGFYMDQKSVAGSYQDLRYSPLAVFQQWDPVNADTQAVFAHVSWSVTDALTLTGGVRYTDEHKDYTFTRLTPSGAVQNPALHGQTGNYDGDRVDYRANVQYAFTDRVNAYVQFSTGFKGGGISPRPFNAAQVRPFGPETLDSWEVGLKSDLFDRKMRLNVAAFYSTYDDIQLTLSTCPQFGGPGPCALVTSAGDAKVKGVELETMLRPVDGLSIDASVSWLDFEYQNIDPAAGGPGLPTGPQLDHRTPYTPEWKASLGIQYEISLGGDLSLTPRLDASYQGDMYSNATNALSNLIESYTLANARLIFRNDARDLEIAAEVTNLFDKYYVLTNVDQSIGTAGLSNDQPGRPREWALTVTKRF